MIDFCGSVYVATATMREINSMRTLKDAELYGLSNYLYMMYVRGFVIRKLCAIEIKICGFYLLITQELHVLLVNLKAHNWTP